MTGKTWGGRFADSPDARAQQFTESVSYDHRLLPHDIRASQAHARMLEAVGILAPGDAKRIAESLDRIGERIQCGEVTLRADLEDIHTHVERELIAELGDLGRKLHSGRSRNDQVVTDVKLWTRDALDGIDAKLLTLQRALLNSAERERGVTLPGYTHLQRAQPVLAAHYFLAYVEKFGRDRERVADARWRLNRLPLGAAALAGTSLPIDREQVQRDLGFDSVAMNSLDVSSDRDFALEAVFALSVVALHLSGWAEEWVIWSTTEFGFVTLPDAFCTGSSIMPHKKNPDALELTRGRSARVLGNLQHLLVLVKGLPLAYNRDLQEDKLAIFDAFDNVSLTLDVAAPLIDGTRLNRERIAERLDAGFLDATTLMEHFVQRGAPLRTAHEAVGKLVRLCEGRHCQLSDLADAEFESACPGATDGVRSVLGVENALAAFRSAGSTAPAEVERQLAIWRERLR